MDKRAYGRSSSRVERSHWKVQTIMGCKQSTPARAFQEADSPKKAQAVTPTKAQNVVSIETPKKHTTEVKPFDINSSSPDLNGCDDELENEIAGLVHPDKVQDSDKTNVAEIKSPKMQVETKHVVDNTDLESEPSLANMAESEKAKYKKLKNFGERNYDSDEEDLSSPSFSRGFPHKHNQAPNLSPQAQAMNVQNSIPIDEEKILNLDDTPVQVEKQEMPNDFNFTLESGGNRVLSLDDTPIKSPPKEGNKILSLDDTPIKSPPKEEIVEETTDHEMEAVNDVDLQPPFPQEREDVTELEPNGHNKVNNAQVEPQVVQESEEDRIWKSISMKYADGAETVVVDSVPNSPKKSDAFEGEILSEVKEDKTSVEKKQCKWSDGDLAGTGTLMLGTSPIPNKDLLAKRFFADRAVIDVDDGCHQA